MAVAFKVQSGFNYYKKGIYKDPSCPQRSPTHAVLATGYAPDYIWVKNSWGTGWGDKGYIKFARIGIYGIESIIWGEVDYEIETAQLA